MAPKGKKWIYQWKQTTVIQKPEFYPEANINKKTRTYWEMQQSRNSADGCSLLLSFGISAFVLYLFVPMMYITICRKHRTIGWQIYLLHIPSFLYLYISLKSTCGKLFFYFNLAYSLRPETRFKCPRPIMKRWKSIFLGRVLRWFLSKPFQLSRYFLGRSTWFF